MSPQDRVRAGLLFDVYGPLLTDHQQDIWQLYYEEDWSLGEIGADRGVSRAAVHDLLERTQRALEDFERRLGLLAQHQRRHEHWQEVMGMVARLSSQTGEVRALGETLKRWAEEEGLTDV